ncbi:MAG: NAD-dependent epimerase/dehydratase family protein [Cyclobacteriaceae bacterium]
MKQTILGANGIIATELAKALIEYTKDIRLVSRNPKKVNDTDEVLPADLMNADATYNAVKGSSIVYLTVGIPYKLKLWHKQWPVIMQNVIEACKKEQAKLVFFDNVYMYGKVDGWMTEATPYRPTSKKGEVRAHIANMLMQEVNAGNLQGLIARAADFYGPNTPASMISAIVFENFAKGKSAMYMLNDKAKHSYTYTPDAGKATALLGNTDSAYGQIWHLPSDHNVLTGEEFIKLTAGEFQIKPKYKVIPGGFLRVLALFNSIVKESLEMLYQNKYDYLFDSSKFQKKFNWQPVSYQEGIKATVASYK